MLACLLLVLLYFFDHMIFTPDYINTLLIIFNLIYFSLTVSLKMVHSQIHKFTHTNQLKLKLKLKPNSTQPNHHHHPLFNNFNFFNSFSKVIIIIISYHLSYRINRVQISGDDYNECFDKKKFFFSSSIFLLSPGEFLGEDIT